MSARDTDLMACLDRARELALAAGRELLGWQERVQQQPPEFKGRRDLVTAADRAAEEVVVAGLQSSFPDHAVLAEEGVLTPQGEADRESDWLWLIDPLDGTTNFVHGIPFFCVALSLSYRDEIVVSVVHAPALGDGGVTYTARRRGGAHRNGEPIAVSETHALRDALLATGFSYHRNEAGYDDNTTRVARVVPLCRDLRRLGSAQLDLCLVASGTFDGYWEMHLAPYDVGAGSLLVTEAGGRVTDLAGGDAWVRQGHVLASNGWLHDELMDVVGGAPD
jgi:myo-inositol-1(or 4)-monophosphatase